MKLVIDSCFCAQQQRLYSIQDKEPGTYTLGQAVDLIFIKNLFEK